MKIKLFGKTLFVGNPAIGNSVSNNWKTDAKELLLDVGELGNGFAAFCMNKEKASKIIAYTKLDGAVTGKLHSLSCVLAKVSEAEGVTAAMFVEQNYLVCVENGLPIYEFYSENPDQVKSKAEYTYNNSFSGGVLVLDERH